MTKAMETPRWNIITPSQYEHERRGLDFIRAGLPDHDPYRAWSNFEFQTSDGAIYEVDLLVLTKTRLLPRRNQKLAGSSPWRCGDMDSHDSGRQNDLRRQPCPSGQSKSQGFVVLAQVPVGHKEHQRAVAGCCSVSVSGRLAL